jgi:hypothetical protein
MHQVVQVSLAVVLVNEELHVKLVVFLYEWELDSCIL